MKRTVLAVLLLTVIAGIASGVSAQPMPTLASQPVAGVEGPG